MKDENETTKDEGEWLGAGEAMFENPLLKRNSRGEYEQIVGKEEADCEAGLLSGRSSSGVSDLESFGDVDNNLTKHRQHQLRMKRICQALLVLLAVVGAAGVAALVRSAVPGGRGGKGAGAEAVQEEARAMGTSGDAADNGDDGVVAAAVAGGGRCSPCCVWGGALSGGAVVAAGAAGVWRLRAAREAEEEAAREAERVRLAKEAEEKAEREAERVRRVQLPPGVDTLRMNAWKRRMGVLY